MKKVLLIIVFCLLSFTFLRAQPSKGKVLVGVSSGFSLAGTGSQLMTLGFTTMKSKSDDGYEDSDPTKTTSFNLLPKVGYFVIDNLAVGLDVSIALSSEKYGDNDSKNSTNMLSVGPFVRYYIPTESVIPFFEIGGTFGSFINKYSYGSDEYENKSSVSSYGLGAGIAIPVGDRVNFDLLAGYNSYTVKDKEDNDSNYRTVVGTIGLELGVIVLLGAN